MNIFWINLRYYSICFIEDIENEKRNKLKENIKCLEDISINLEQKIKELKPCMKK